MSITETWLKGYITDSQVQIPDYNVYRADRSAIRKGGALLFVHNTLTVSRESYSDDSVCQCALLNIDSLNTVVASVYRPPGTKLSSFKKVLMSIQAYLDDSGNHDVYITGDFNLPNIDWETLNIGSELGVNGTLSAQALLDFMSGNFLTQVVDKPTRDNNILDLVLTNVPNYVADIESTETRLSDHNLVCAQLAFDARSNTPRGHMQKPVEDGTFFGLNLHKADMDSIAGELDKVDWEALKTTCPENDSGAAFAELIRAKTLEVCAMFTPKKSEQTVSPYQLSRNRKILNRKRRKLKCRQKSLKQVQPDSPRLRNIEDELSILAVKIRDAIEDDISSRERKAVECVKSNPRYFYSYAKKFSKLKSNIGPIKDGDGALHHEPEKMAQLLQEQFSSVFSNPENTDLKDTTNTLPKIPSSFNSFEFNEDDIIEAINEIDPNSSTPNNDIPAKVIKACKSSLAKAFTLLWKDSYDNSNIPQCFKNQFIAPIYKKDSKLDPANYRPISLTSHVIKIFERVVRKNLVRYLEENNLLSSKQHGFRKGRSCLTQLLKHYDTILNNYLNNTETDVIYLDYAKAFDKVDHQLLLKKLHHYGIGGKVYDWIEQFLLDRTQTVVVDGLIHSLVAFEISGVTQGTVLGPHTFPTICQRPGIQNTTFQNQ